MHKRGTKVELMSSQVRSRVEPKPNMCRDAYARVEASSGRMEVNSKRLETRMDVWKQVRDVLGEFETSCTCMTYTVLLTKKYLPQSRLGYFGYNGY